MQRLSINVVLFFIVLSTGTASAGGAVGQPSAVDPAPNEVPPPQSFEQGIPTAALALYKTISYTSAVLMTDQFWYMVAASQAAGTSGWFGVVNTVTSPVLTYGFEYVWDNCCVAPPGPDGIVPVQADKAIIYRVVSTARVAAVALAFGNSLGSSALVTGAIALTRTGVYAVNDYVWGRIDRRTPVQTIGPRVTQAALMPR